MSNISATCFVVILSHAFTNVFVLHFGSPVTNQYSAALHFYLQAGAVCSDYFTKAVPLDVYNDQVRRGTAFSSGVPSRPTTEQSCWATIIACHVIYATVAL